MTCPDENSREIFISALMIEAGVYELKYGEGKSLHDQVRSIYLAMVLESRGALQDSSLAEEIKPSR